MQSATHDISISVGGTVTGFMLAELNGRKAWKASEVPQFGPRMSIDDAKYAQTLPEFEFVWAQRSFHGGLGRLEWDDKDGFQTSSGLDTSIKGQVILGPLGGTVNVVGTVTVTADPVAYCEFKGTAYMANAGTVHYWNGTTNWPTAGTVGPGSAITDLRAVNGYIVACLGSNKLLYSANGTAYTQSAGTLSEIDYITEIRGIAWGVGGTNKVYSTSDVTGAWTLQGTVGDSLYGFTGIYNCQDFLLIGKQDGFYSIDRDGAVYEVLGNYKRKPASTNFKNGAIFQGKLYLPTFNELLEYDPLTGVVKKIGPRGYGETTSTAYAITAVASDPSESWLFALSTGTTGGVLLKGRPEIVEGELDWRWHEIGANGAVSTSQPIGITVAQTTNPNLWLRISGTNTFKKFILPYLHPNPYYDTNCRFESGEQVRTSQWDGGFPDILKALTKIDVRTANLSATQTVQCRYYLDEGSVNILGTITSGVLTTLYFPTNTTAKKVELRFDLFTTDTAETPVFKGFVLHAVLRPPIRKLFDFTVKAKDAVTMRNGQLDPQDAMVKANRLTTARQQDWPFTLTDTDGTAWNVLFAPGMTDENVYNEKDRAVERHFTIRAFEVKLS